MPTSIDNVKSLLLVLTQHLLDCLESVACDADSGGSHGDCWHLLADISAQGHVVKAVLAHA